MLPSSLQATCVLVFAITTLTHSGVNASLNTGQDEILALVQESTHSSDEDDLHRDPISMFLDGFPPSEADAQPAELKSPSLSVISSARFEEDAAQLLRHRIPPESGNHAVRAMQLKATAKEAEAEAACPSLSATELATVAKPSLDMTDIGSFVVFAVYLISAAALVPTIRTRSGNVPGSLRCPSLLYAGIVVGLLLAAASATPPLFRSYDVVFHTMVWFQVVGLPMAILLQCVRMHNEMAHVQLYAQRLVVTQALRASQGVKAGGTNSDEAARHLARCIAATTPQRMAVLALPVIFVLMAAAAIAHAMLNPCSELVLGPFGLAGALAPSLLGFIAQATLSAMLLRLLTVDAYHRRIELVCHCALNGAALMALPVTAFVLNAAHPTVVLLVSFRLGTALLATAGLVTSLVLAYLVRRTGSEGAAADKVCNRPCNRCNRPCCGATGRAAQAGFDTLFSPASAELKAKFNEFLNTQLAGHLLLFYDEVHIHRAHASHNLRCGCATRNM